MEKRLYRTEGRDRMISGVCGGVAEFFGIDPSIVRIVWAVGVVCSFSLFFWVYVVCAIVLPRKSDIYPGY